MSLILSSNPTFIYAGDLARIRARTWLLLGHSDLSLTLQSIGGDSRDVLAQGGVCLDVRGTPAVRELWGRYDRGAIIPPHDDTMKIHAWHRIDVVAYCLTPEATTRLFGDVTLEMRRVRSSVIGRMAMQDRYAGAWAESLMSKEEFELSSSPRKRFRFLERLEQLMPDLGCYILPFQGYQSDGLVRLHDSETDTQRNPEASISSSR